MNGGQDLGGKHGLGPINPEKNEPVFHAEWERRAFGLTMAMGSTGEWNIDAGRHARENRNPADYINASYYQVWLFGLEVLLRERDLLLEGELESGIAQKTRPVKNFLRAEHVDDILNAGGSYARAIPNPAQFSIGDKVKTKNHNPKTHTRLPGYARNKTGVIDSINGGFVFPDTNARFVGEHPQYCYSVRFEAKELWGSDTTSNSCVYLDMWESYLDPA